MSDQKPLKRKRKRLYEALPAEDEKAIVDLVASVRDERGKPAVALEKKSEEDSARQAEQSKEDLHRHLQREEAFEILEETFVAAGRWGLLPLPALDWLAVATVQRKLFHEIAEVYEREIGDAEAQYILTGMAMASGSATLGTSVLGSMAKWVPFLGSVVGGGAVSLSAAAFTWAAGKALIEFFDQTPTGGISTRALVPLFQEFQEEGRKKALDALASIAP